MREIKSGVYPVMLTPFHEDGSVDYAGLGNFTNWFIDKGVQGLFAVCGSSEMTELTLDERVAMAQAVVETAAGRADVVASGHISPDPAAQVEEINAIAATGIAGFVLVSGRVVQREQSSVDFCRRIDYLLSNTGDTTFGIYECPSPYKRELTADEMKYLAGTNRFSFMKDTCGNNHIVGKIEAARGSRLKVFNADSTTILASLQAGACGFSGIMANYHPDLYVKLWELHRQGRVKECQELHAALSLLHMAQLPYNIGTKYYLQQFEGVAMAGGSRVMSRDLLTDYVKLQYEQFYHVTQQLRSRYSA